MERLKAVKKIIHDSFDDAPCGLFFTRNIRGDTMENIYQVNGVDIDICYDFMYFEVFGLDDGEQEELLKYYNKLKADLR